MSDDRPGPARAVGNECAVGSFWRGSRNAFREIAIKHGEHSSRLKDVVADLVAALKGLESRYDPGVFCDHAAAPCDRCDAAVAALKKAGVL